METQEIITGIGCEYVNVDGHLTHPRLLSKLDIYRDEILGLERWTEIPEDEITDLKIFMRRTNQVIEHFIGDSVHTHIYIETQENNEVVGINTHWTTSEIIHINVLIFEEDMDLDLVGRSINILVGVSARDDKAEDPSFGHIPDLVSEEIFDCPLNRCDGCCEGVFSTKTPGGKVTEPLLFTRNTPDGPQRYCVTCRIEWDQNIAPYI